MNHFVRYIFKILLLVVVLMTGSLSFCEAQKILNRPVSITANRQSVSEVLQTLGKQGGFYFSYNSEAIPGDSIVTILFRDNTLRTVLDKLLAGNYLYKETGDYVIIQKAPAEKYLYITGTIKDSETGKPVDYASIYSKTLLVSALSDDDGSFRLRLRERTFPLILSVSKIGYADTTLVIQSEKDVSSELQLTPRAIDLEEVMVYNSGADRTFLARLFVSSRLRAQSRNIGRFFVSLPYQASLTPGLGTHGRMSSQVTNKFSLNLLGGYTAGVNGVELAGAFNISKNNVRLVQVAGIFNVVSGHVKGLQLAGVHNHVIDSLRGVQVAGFGNIVGKRVNGVQMAGFFNKVSDGFGGLQISGVGNLTDQTSNGVQISGMINRSGGDFKGLQIAGAVNLARGNVQATQISSLLNLGKAEVSGLQLGTANYAKNLKGVQVGIFNIADSSSGYSIGIFNIIKNGKGEVSVFASEVAPYNVAWKTGSKKIYSILTVGASFTPNHKVYTMGFGLGKDFRLSRSLAFAAEFVNSTGYTGSWENTIGMYRLQTLLDLRIGKRLTMSAGPAITIMQDKNIEGAKGYRDYPPKTYASFDIGKSVGGWLGWQAGICWNYGAVW
jgi:hypothetical protein